MSADARLGAMRLTLPADQVREIKHLIDAAQERLIGLAQHYGSSVSQTKPIRFEAVADS
jgi:hypothetical protein